MPLSLFGGDDKMWWKGLSSGEYNVKSGYVRAEEMDEQHQQRHSVEGQCSKDSYRGSHWKFLWSLRIKGKLQHFVCNILMISEIQREDVFSVWLENAASIL